MTTRFKFGLPGPADTEYWMAIHEWAEELKSDGCSYVIDFRRPTCLEHDCHWRSGHTLFGDPISKWEANVCFRESIQQRSKFGRFSPMAWGRFVGVSIGAIFKKDTKES